MQNSNPIPIAIASDIRRSYSLCVERPYGFQQPRNALLDAFGARLLQARSSQLGISAEKQEHHNRIWSHSTDRNAATSSDKALLDKPRVTKYALSSIKYAMANYRVHGHLNVRALLERAAVTVLLRENLLLYMQ